MELTPEMITLGTELASIAGRKSVEAIFDKIRTVKKKGDKDEIISNLEEIINDLISDKNRLIQISQAYEENLITQKITQEEIDYITNSIIPLLEEFLKQSSQDDSRKIQDGINAIKPILSKEIFNIMQILGFNFKEAIGEPLTELLAAFIRTKINTTERSLEIQMLAQQREVEYLKICQDKKAYNRLMSIYQRNK
ncbi:hypothetical protein IMSAGC007_00967 [Lachnospiraceae bacterium]|nr:hypothetical protein IMSAGC007_00967 [Lachnospiraceae bacterium]